MSDVLTRLEENLVGAAARQTRPRRRRRQLVVVALAIALVSGTVATAHSVWPGVREDDGTTSTGERYHVTVLHRRNGELCLLAYHETRGGACGRLRPPLYAFTPVGRDLLVFGLAPTATVQVEATGRSGAHALGRPYTESGVPGKLFAVRLRNEVFPHPCVVLRDAHGRELGRIGECHRGG